MKKLLLSVLILFTVLATSGCAMMFAGPQYEYDYEEQHNDAEFSRIMDYASFGWQNAQYDIEYGYYNSDRLFLVIINGQIFIVPYDYFYRHIFPYYILSRLHWRSYDYFCGLWGWRYYNRLWSYYYYRHNRYFWRPQHDWYGYHRHNNNNSPLVIRKNEVRPPFRGNHYQVRPKLEPRIYNPNNNRPRIYERGHIGANRVNNPPIRNRVHIPLPSTNSDSGRTKEKKD